jgi:uncharacterized membrane protein YagU involved in acid resistance
MTPLRIVARRNGLIDRTVPQAIESTLVQRSGRGHRAPPVAHHLTDQALHFGYGAMLGLAYGLATGRQRRRWSGILARGLTFGAATWLLGSGVVIPALGAARPLWRARPSEALTDLAAHAIFGLATALITDDLGRQNDHGPKSKAPRLVARVG